MSKISRIPQPGKQLAIQDDDMAQYAVLPALKYAGQKTVLMGERHD